MPIQEFEPAREIISTDPGIDDAVALLVGYATLHNPALVATYGNGTTERTFANLKGIKDFVKENRKVNREIPLMIYAGAEGPSNGAPFKLEEKYGDSLDFIHGKGAMEGFGLDVLPISDEERSGVLYEREVNDENTKVDLFSFGAVTEIQTILKNPKMLPKVKSITIMGGTINEPGNVEPHLEANLRHDPEALVDIIQIANANHINITFVTLDVSHQKQLEFTPQRCEQLVSQLRQKGSPKIADLIQKLAGPDSKYFDFYTSIADRRDPKDHITPRSFEGPPIHDLTALMAKKFPDLFKIAKDDVITVTTEGPERGAIGEAQNHMNSTGTVDIVKDIKNDHSAELYWSLVADVLAGYYN